MELNDKIEKALHAEQKDHEISAGWRLILASALGIGFGSVGFATYAIGAFIDPLGKEFGWSRAEVQGAIAFGVGLGGFAAPIIGMLIDRYGGRSIAIYGLLGVTVGYLMASTAGGNLCYFYLAYAAVAVLGAGSGPVSWTRAVAARFDRRRGLALALTLSGTGMAAIVVPPYAVLLVENFGWRVGYVGLACLPLFALPFVLLFFFPAKSGPAAAAAAPVSTDAASAPPTGLTLKQATSSYRFWLLLFSILAMYLGITGIVPNLIPALTDKGFTPSAAAAVQSVYGFSLIVARLGIGWLLDRFWGPAVAALVLTSPVMACLILIGEPNYATAIIASALIGAAAGAELDLLAFFTARYFGIRNYGRIYGFLYTGVAFGAGLGPVAFAYLSDLTGSYNASFQGALVLFALGGTSILFLGRYPNLSAETRPANH
ncbi:MFS transporter [Sphingopyxis sp.]|uniref:MFS transporter n=1 Tax=Sphingopyxis sp. TaxID=1908224 RepID=UPI002B4A0764|nr:MFS transporter [Sphingopyxis sp.]HJS09791.1 MFS transporter [Sphingopyxis sp.]